jgi:signal transduction histidine kinase/serine/threonine protein kinase/CheY-like chemotaxis protein
MWLPSGLTHVRSIGRGAETEVHLCHDVRTGERVSLKVADAETAARDLIRAEYELLRTIDYRGLPSARDHGTDGEHAYLTYAYVDGRNLADGANCGNPDAFDAVAVGLFGALLVLHDLGWVHYDITPHNILVGDEPRWDRLRLIDLGLAGRAGRTLLGSPGYMAPEILRGEPGGPDSDIYSAGVVLAELALGESLFPGRTQREVLDNTKPVLQSIRPRLDEVIGIERAGMVLDALSPSRQDREGDAHAYLTRLADMEAPGAARCIEEAVIAIVRGGFDPAEPRASLVSMGWEVGSAGLLSTHLAGCADIGRFDVARCVGRMAADGRVRRHLGSWAFVGFDSRWLADGLDREHIRRELGRFSTRDPVLALAAGMELDDPEVTAQVGRGLGDDLKDIPSDLLTHDAESGVTMIVSPAVAYAMLGAATFDERTVAHARAAHILAEIGTDEADAGAAYHRLRAGQPVGPDTAAAMDAASHRGLLRIARPLAEAVKRSLEEGETIAPEIVLAAARVEMEARSWSRCQWLLDRVTGDASPELSFMDALCEIRTRGGCTWRRGDPRRGGRLDAALAAHGADLLASGEEHPVIAESLDDIEALLGRPAPAGASLADRVARLAECGVEGTTLGRAGILTTLSALGNREYARGEIESSTQIMLAARDLAGTWGMALRAAQFESNHASGLLRLGHKKEAAEILSRLADTRQALGDSDGAAVVWGNLGVIRFDEGDVRSALASWKRGMDLAWKTGDMKRLGSTQGRMACALQEIGDWAGAERAFVSSVKLASTFGGLDGEILARLNLVGLHLGAGRIARARRERDVLVDRMAGHSLPADRRALFGYLSDRLSLEVGERLFDAEAQSDMLRRLAAGEDEVLPGLDAIESCDLVLVNALLVGHQPEDEPEMRRLQRLFPDDKRLGLLAHLAADEGGPSDDDLFLTLHHARERELDTEAVGILSVLAEAAIRREAARQRTPGTLVEDLRSVAGRCGIPGLRWRAGLAWALKSQRRGHLLDALRGYRDVLGELTACFAAGTHDLPPTLWRRPDLVFLLQGVRRLAESIGLSPKELMDGDPVPDLHALLTDIALELSERGSGRDGRRERGLERILGTMEVLNTTHEVGSLLDRIVGNLLDLCDAEYGFVVLRDDEGRTSIRTAQTSCGGVGSEIDNRFSRTVVARVFSGRKPILIPNALDEADLVDRTSVRSLSLRSIMAAPMIHKGRVLGAVCVDNRTASGSFDRDDLRILSIFANQAAVAIENGRLIEELRESCHELAETREQMVRTETMRTVGLMAGGIAHDFNNLLTSILGNADLVSRHLEADSTPVRMVEEIKSASVLAADLCRQLLTYAGGNSPVVEVVDLSESVRGVEEVLRVSIPKNVDLAFELPEDLPGVEVDATQIRQVLMNLIVNASESFDGEAGEIRIRTAVRDLDEAALAGLPLLDCLPAGRYAVLEVEDTGCGMDATSRARAFDPFYTTKFTGRGMGLATVHGAVRGHEGGISVRSASGKGTLIGIYLPCSGQAAATVESAPASSDWRGRGTVLLVDDEDMVRRVAHRMLEMIGFVVLEARDGREAIDVFGERSDEIALVLLDMTMPRMGGKETFIALRTLRSDLPIVVSSGHGEAHARGEFHGHGLTGFVPKPYQFRALREKIREAIE